MARIDDDDDELSKARAAEGADDELQGEGNRSADRRYRDATRQFIAEGKVAKAAEEARRALDDDDEREELKRAKEAGRSRAKEHDPELKR